RGGQLGRDARDQGVDLGSSSSTAAVRSPRRRRTPTSRAARPFGRVLLVPRVSSRPSIRSFAHRRRPRGADTDPNSLLTIPAVLKQCGAGGAAGVSSSGGVEIGEPAPADPFADAPRAPGAVQRQPRLWLGARRRRARALRAGGPLPLRAGTPIL